MTNYFNYYAKLMINDFNIGKSLELSYHVMTIIQKWLGEGSAWLIESA